MYRNFCFIALILTLAATACKPATTREGVCFHPLVMGGMPFALADDAKFGWNGDLSVNTGDGQVTLSGAMCVIQYK
jgi:hypothetical protein